MRLSPLDIKKQDFNRGFRGFEEEEVTAFLQMLADQWDEVLEETRRLESKVTDLENKLQHYQRVEDALQEALNTAKSSSKTKLANAEQEAALVIREAHSKAQEILSEAKHANQKLIQSNITLDQRQQEILARLRAFLSSELDMLSGFDKQSSAIPPLKAPVESADPRTNGSYPAAAPAIANIHDAEDVQSSQPDEVRPETVSWDQSEYEGDTDSHGNEDLTEQHDSVNTFDDQDDNHPESTTQTQESEQVAPIKEDRPPQRDNVSPADMDKIRQILDRLD